MIGQEFNDWPGIQMQVLKDWSGIQNLILKDRLVKQKQVH